jgi:hypothetical protein
LNFFEAFFFQIKNEWFRKNLFETSLNLPYTILPYFLLYKTFFCKTIKKLIEFPTPSIQFTGLENICFIVGLKICRELKNDFRIIIIDVCNEKSLSSIFLKKLSSSENQHTLSLSGKTTSICWNGLSMGWKFFNYNFFLSRFSLPSSVILFPALLCELVYVWT